MAVTGARLGVLRLNAGRLNAAAASVPASPSPAHGAQAGPFTLTWAASGATSYQVRFGTSPTPPPFTTTTSNSAAIPVLVDGQTYYWQVVATGAMGSPQTGPVWSFVARKPAAPTLVAPANGTTNQAAPVTLTWAAVTNTTPVLYDVTLGTPALGVYAEGLAGTSYTVPTLASDVTYRWQIVARNNAGSSASAVWSFATRIITGFIATLGGVTATQRIRIAGISIRDDLNHQPNTAAFTVDGTAPTVGQEVRFGLGTLGAADCLFSGRIDTVTTTYESIGTNRAWRVTAQDHTPGLNRRKVRRRYAQQSATTIAQDLLTRYGPASYTGTAIAANLPIVEGGIDFTEVDLSDCFTRLSERIGGYWYVDYEKDVHLFIAEVTNAPTPITASARVLLNEPAITHQSDVTQIRTRTLVEGGGAEARVPIAPGATSLPVTDASWYAGTGGIVVSGPQRITYTGKGTAGGPPAPTVAEAGDGNLNGTYSWKYAHVISGTEATLSPASAAITVGKVAAPSTPLGAAAQLSPTYVADPTYVAQSATTQYPGTAIPPNQSINYWITFVTPTGGETNFSPAVSLFAASGWANARFVNFNVGPGAPKVAAVRLIRGGSPTYYLLGTFDPRGDLNFTDDKPDSALTPWTVPSGGNTTAPGAIATGAAEWVYTFATAIGETQRSAVTALTIAAGTTGVLLTVPTSPSARCTSRKIYRSKRNTPGVYYLEATIADNTTTSYLSTKADAALGAAYVHTDTSGPSGGVTVAGITTGPAGTGARRLYRPEAGGTVYKLVVVLNDNTTTTYVDTKADSALGAVAAGEAVLELTGIPASGTGAVLYDIAAGEAVNLLVQVDDAAAQAQLAALEGPPSDGIVEHYIQDGRLGLAQATATGKADLALFARPILTVTYATRDPKTRSGKTATITLPDLGIVGDFVIQTVDIDQIDLAPGLFPRYRVTASSVRFSFEDLLRRLALQV